MIPHTNKQPCLSKAQHTELRACLKSKGETLSGRSKMSKVSIAASELMRLRLTVAINAKAKLWGVSEFAVADVVNRAMQSAQLDETTGELKNFDASVFLSGLEHDPQTRHLVSSDAKPLVKSANPIHGDLTEAQFNALSPEERLKRANAAYFADKQRAA